MLNFTSNQVNANYNWNEVNKHFKTWQFWLCIGKSVENGNSQGTGGRINWYDHFGKLCYYLITYR